MYCIFTSRMNKRGEEGIWVKLGKEIKFMKTEFLLKVQWALSASKVVYYCDGRYEVCV
jgi:hypothetical protein